VQTPAALTVVAFTARAAANVGQVVPVSLTLRNTGGAPARITAVTPTPTGTAGISCTAPQPPASPSSPEVVGNAQQITFTWNCTGTQAGTYDLGAGITATDANWSAVNPAPTVTASPLTVQQPAALAVTSFTSSRSTAAIGQGTTVTLRLHNSGGAPADVTSVTPGSTPAAGMTCGAVSPAVSTSAPARIAGGATLDFTWSCSGSTTGTYGLTASVSAADVNDGTSADVTASGASVTVQTNAVLAGALAPSRTTADVNQPVTVTLTLTNSGGATAHVSAVAPSPGASCGSPTPTSVDVPGAGAQRTVTWTCSGSTAGTLTLGAGVTAVDANTGADVSPTVATVAVTVQAPASLTGVLSYAAPAGVVTFTLGLTNNGGATARVTAASLTVTAGATVLDCSAAVRSALPDIVGSGTGQVTWSPCTATGTAGNTATVHVVLTVTDLNTGTDVSPSVPDLAFTIP
jgi:hypothetical protein